jgi:hypothetical protein
MANDVRSMSASNASGRRSFHASKNRRITALFCSVVVLNVKLRFSYLSRNKPHYQDDSGRTPPGDEVANLNRGAGWSEGRHAS